MQDITDKEFEREVEALKSHRRISATNRPLMDPDLPDMAAIRGGGQEIMAAGPSNPLAAYGSLSSQYGTQADAGEASLDQARTGTLRWRVGVDLRDEGPSQGPSISRGATRQAFTARRRTQAEGTGSATGSSRTINRPRSPAARSTASRDSDTSTGSGGPTDPSHLFWVPASVHPEISPSHFREFLQEHASRAAKEHSPPGSASSGSSGSYSQFGVVGSPSPPLGASSAHPSTTPPISPISLVPRTSIARRGSTLRRQYRPDADAEDDDSIPSIRPPPLPRTREGEPLLSINDLQRLEALAEEASKSIDESELRSVLRRTMSLGAGATSTMDAVDAVPPAGEDMDAPIIVPPPGQILRRAARTKIRKSSMGSTDVSERARRLSKRRDLTTKGRDSMSDSVEGSEGDRDSKADLSGIAAVLLANRRGSDASDLSLIDDDAEAGRRPVSDTATDSIVDAYSRDSFFSEGSQRTSLTSLTESDTVSPQMQQKWSSVRGQDLGTPPPSTPTPQNTLDQQALGYFDLSLDSTDTATGPTPHLSKSTSVMFESPVGSPEEEHTPEPSATLSGRLKAQSLEEEPAQQQANWPVPVSHVPPVPGFEKTRPTSQPPAVAPPASRPATSTTSTTTQQQQQQQQQQQAQSIVPAPIAPSPSSRSHPPPTPVAASPSKPTKEKEKKSGFASWFGIGKDEDESKHAKEERRREKYQRKEREREDEAASAAANQQQGKGEKEKDVGSFLGALFGKKKGHDDHRDGSHGRYHDGQITSGSLLDQRSGRYGGGPGEYRYPIHVERAVYRLSHIKLANPRRPLYEQVLISNLMFWYLSIVNRSQQQARQQQQQQQMAQIQASNQSQPPTNKSSEALSDGNAGSAILGTVIMESSTGSLGSSGGGAPAPEPIAVPIVKPPTPQKTKRSGLVKPNRAPPGGRSAEMPILQAGYSAQHQQVSSDLALQQQQQQQQQQAHALPSNISVGQVIDPRALHYGYNQSAPSASTESDDPRLAASNRNSGGVSKGPKTSPGLTAQRIVRAVSGGLTGSSSSSSIDKLTSSSGAWLGSGGAAGEDRGSAGSPRRSPTRSPNSRVEDEHSWLGGLAGNNNSAGAGNEQQGYFDQGMASNKAAPSTPPRQPASWAEKRNRKVNEAASTDDLVNSYRQSAPTSQEQPSATVGVSPRRTPGRVMSVGQQQRSPSYRQEGDDDGEESVANGSSKRPLSPRAVSGPMIFARGGNSLDAVTGSTTATSPDGTAGSGRDYVNGRW